MNHTTYIKNLFYSFIQDSEFSSEQMMFIKHYNTLDVSLEGVEQIVGEMYKEGLLYHRFSKNDIKSPYEPFMNGIRYYYQKFFSKEMSIADFIEKCDVYSLQKDIFISYLENGLAMRNEIIISAEYGYEKEKFVASIINCLDFIATKRKILIILNRLQLAALSTLDVIDKIMNSQIHCDIKILLIYNELEVPLQYIEKKFNKIISDAEEKNILFEWDSSKEETIKDYHASFIPLKRYFGDYIKKLNNLYHMLAIEDAQYYLDLINSRIVEEKLNIDNSEKFRFYTLQALCKIITKNPNEALLVCEKLKWYYKEDTDLVEEYTYNYICGMAHMCTIQSELANKYADKCKKVAAQLKNEKMQFYADLLAQGIQFSGWKDVFVVNYDHIKVDYALIEQLKKNNFMNTLAYYYIFGFDNTSEEIGKIVKGARSKTFEEALKIGHELNNTNFLLTAYTKYILLFNDKGFSRYVDEFYSEKLKLLDRDDNAIRKAHFFMGMGYNCIVSEQFIKANEYFNKAIEILYDLKQAETITEAIYNMALNCVCAQDYLSACDYLNTIFKMMNNLGIESVVICNQSKLYGLLSLSYYMVGNEYRSYKCLSEMKMLLSHILDNDEADLSNLYEDIFIYYVLSGIHIKRNGDLQEALNYFKKAEKYYSKCLGTVFFMITTYAEEYYDLCVKLNMIEQGTSIIRDALEFCKKNGYLSKCNFIMMAVEGKNRNVRPITTSFSTITLQQMIELSYHVGVEKKLQDSKKDIQFLSLWQELLNKREFNIQLLLKSAMNMLQNNFKIDKVLLLDKVNEDIVELYKDEEIVEKIEYDQIYEFFNILKKDFIVNRTEKSFAEYEKIISLFGYHKIVTMIGIPIINENGIRSIFIAIVNIHSNFRKNHVLLNEDDLLIVKTALIQLMNALDRIEDRKNIVQFNEQLRSLVITDVLTGLYNRQGLAKMIEENADENNSVTILYADLDNFKYYNDTFGHEIGDLVLVQFAKVFKKVSEKNGYAVRYGGDEFLIILNNVDREKVIEVTNEIYKDCSDGFAEIVSEHINKKVSIPENKKVSCSIGIATCKNGLSQNITETLQKADKALYYMKKNHKGSYVLWENIHEQETN